VTEGPIDPGRVSVVMPARDEAATIDRVIADLKRVAPGVREMIVVDDGSVDATRAVADRTGAIVIAHPTSRGYGAAVKSGILAAKSEFVLVLDADGQHRPDDVPALLAEAATHDLVTGHRVRVFHSSAWKLPGKWLLRHLGGYLIGRRIPDLNCGFRVFRRETILRYLPLCSDGYSFSSTSLLLLLHEGHHVAFVPVDVTPARRRGRVTVRTGFDTVVLLLRITTLLDPLRIFLPLSLVLFIAGIAWGTPYAVAGHGVSVGALLLLLTAVLLFGVGLVSDQIAQLRKEWLER